MVRGYAELEKQEGSESSGSCVWGRDKRLIGLKPLNVCIVKRTDWPNRCQLDTAGWTPVGHGGLVAGLISKAVGRLTFQAMFREVRSG